MRKTRIAFINTHPIQYFAPLYAYLNQSEDLAVTAMYLSDFCIRGAVDSGFGREVKWDIDLLSGYEARFIKGAEKRGEPRGYFSMVAPGLWRELRRGAFDAVIVHGHWPASHILGTAAAKFSRIPVFMRGETHLGLERRPLKAWLRKSVMSAFYAQFDGMLAIGSANAAFYRAMGVPDRRIFSAPYTVDNARFIKASQLTPAERHQLRRSLGVADDRPIILFASKFEERKGPRDLLRAAAALESAGRQFQLVMVGSGELDADLRQMARQLALRQVHFHGFSNQSELPRIYGASDVFVLPSKNEPWGLAVNEAMCASLPIVASTEMGCTQDLVRDRVNGRTFAATDVAGLCRALTAIVDDREGRIAMGSASLDIISRWSYAEVQDGIRLALRSAGLQVLPPMRAAT